MIKTLIRRLLYVVVYPNFFIASCATLMAWETGHILGSPVSARTLLLLFLATISVYSFHALVSLRFSSHSNRNDWNIRHKRWLSLQMLTSGILMVYIMHTGRNAYRLWLAGGLGALLYSAPRLPGKAGTWLRKIVFGKTAYLAFMWTFATTILPMGELDLSNLSILPFFGYRFFLVYAICILFDYRDKEEDRQRGVKTLPLLVDSTQLRRFFLLSLVLSSACFLWLQLTHGLSATWPLGLPVLLLTLLSGMAQQNRSDFLYYVVLDGLMALSALVTAVIKWLTL